MNRIVTAVVLGIATSVVQPAFADQIPGSQTKVANWSIAAYDKNSKFSHCAMSAPYVSGITMLFSVSGNYTWRLGWTHPSWQFSKDQSVDITVFVDEAGPFYLKATAVSKAVAVAELPAKAAVFDVMRKGYLMTVHAVGNVYKFKLDGTFAALTEILSCAERYSTNVASAPLAPPPAAVKPESQYAACKALAAWAELHPEIIVLYLFGSHARGEAHAGSDLDLAFELADPRAWESDEVVLIDRRERWRRELSSLTGSYVRDLYLRNDPNISGPFKEIYRRS
jgi:predicted nucleotidyltransferase